ncbi:transcription factor domain-containing protein [Aspergillus brunneoviolaceus CBS 621.78]|uniref:C6 transcription factor n=1 Tax=Aspergillus brunneoviolaceus CBS 621.78 TaxID=1450534 RepID=A0ACD1GML5_9EURO|nr:C6 transcription factor [Aspergillus brunneoviolaceus CBS 621.78]RAH50362.1 C6 transcription factor [Aspergillus brunneoviolaceus CBS 621.78]
MTSLSSPKRWSSADGSATPHKRHKITVACDECRVRKVRCDGIHPVCGPCVRKGDREKCIYTGDKKRAMQSYVKGLENRLKLLENPGRAQVGSTQSLGAESPQVSRDRVCQDTTPDNRQTPRQHTDGVNAMMGEVEEERLAQGFFGSSSAASFIRQIRTAIDQRVPSPYRGTSDSILGAASSSGLKSSRIQRPSTISNYVLPPRKTADSLMEVYWTFVFPLYPLIDSLNLRAEYSRLWTGEPSHSDENMLMCTFNVIFALACQLADFIPPEEREASADAFFSRAKDLLQFNLWNTGSAELIQCLLLMAQYLQSTDSAHQCWIVTGLAIRNAQSLGLHLPQTSARLRNPQEKQLARKIWHGCVLMDRVISMTFGRPSMIAKASGGSVPLPATVDEEYIPSAGTAIIQPAGRPSVMAFYAKSLELYEILNDILLSLYNPNPDESPEDVYDFYFNKQTTEGGHTMFELDRALTKWSRTLPEHLRGDASLAYGDKMFYHQSVVLRARFLHVRMLLFRPILSKYCTSRDIGVADPLICLQDSFPQRIALQCSIICVKVAQEVIGLIHGHIPADGSAGPLPAWWYNILYVYTAATVLIAGRLCPAILEEVTEPAITESWDHALEILRRYHSYSTSARRCVAALEILYERVVSEGRSTDQELPAQAVQTGSSMSNGFGDVSLGEGFNSGLFDGIDLLDFQDMSWLNSVPSNLF